MSAPQPGPGKAGSELVLRLLSAGSQVAFHDRDFQKVALGVGDYLSVAHRGGFGKVLGHNLVGDNANDPDGGCGMIGRGGRGEIQRHPIDIHGAT